MKWNQLGQSTVSSFKASRVELTSPVTEGLTVPLLALGFSVDMGNWN
jgi:hypothetical protein